MDNENQNTLNKLDDDLEIKVMTLKNQSSSNMDSVSHKFEETFKKLREMDNENRNTL